jgi:hypothetical protein
VAGASLKGWPCCDPAGQMEGFLFTLALHRAAPEDLAGDPAAGAAWRHRESHAPLRPGEAASFFRFWMAKESHQKISEVQSLLFIQMALHYLTTRAVLQLPAHR